MKRFVYVLLTIVGVVALSIVSSLGYNYYEDQKYADYLLEDTTENAQLEEAVASVLNPTFTSVDDVYQFRQRIADENSIDSTFRAIPQEALINIAQVVIKRQGSATKRDIVYEYRQNYNTVYKFIDSSINTKLSERPKDSSDVQLDKLLNEASPKIRTDTIIDGKKFTIID